MKLCLYFFFFHVFFLYKIYIFFGYFSIFTDFFFFNFITFCSRREDKMGEWQGGRSGERERERKKKFFFYFLHTPCSTSDGRCPKFPPNLFFIYLQKLKNNYPPQHLKLSACPQSNNGGGKERERGGKKKKKNPHSHIRTHPIGTSTHMLSNDGRSC